MHQTEHARVLDAEGAHIGTGGADAGDDIEMSLAVHAGEAVLVHCAHRARSAVLADACAGLVPPSSGTIRFLGRDWAGLDDRHTQALRARIGRVFLRAPWIDHLDVATNVLLPLLHHTRESTATLLREAARLGRDFGLPGLPHGRIADCDPGDLQRVACVRAFLGRPHLVILEHPTVGVPQLVAPLVDAIRAVRQRGAAVLWVTPSEAIWGDPALPFDRRLRLAGRLLDDTGTAP